jgi:hypothetical protein
MKHFILFVIIISSLLIYQPTHAQGCVAVRNMSSCSLNFDSIPKGSWQLALNYRYFESFRHFRGNHQEKERVQNGTQVINHDNSVLLGITYNFNNRFSAAMLAPFVYFDRSSLYEHKGNSSGERYSTSAKGIGDIRIMGYMNTTPNSHSTYLAVGLGIKLPTGNYDAKDYFHRLDPEGQEVLVLRPVDQSIQPGDGGTGAIIEFDFAYMFARNFTTYATGTYLVNPRNTNGTLRSNNLVNSIPLSNEMSVPDQFLLRAGVRYAVRNALQFALGGRYEGIPVEDVFGRSDGFRRPGYILSLEPAVVYSSGRHTFGINVPVALERNRTQSVLDKKRTEATGTYRHGDAAFADYLISLSYACRFFHDNK